MSIRPFLSVAGLLFPDPDRTWIVLGKGPTLSKYAPETWNGCYTLSLNHVISMFPVDVAHLIDMDVVEQCGESLLKNSRFVVMPWVPHIRHRATLLTPHTIMDTSGITLEEWTLTNPVLAELSDQNRLLCYNLSSARPRFRRADDPNIVQVAYFSASAAVNLLAAAGGRKIRTFGVDGGVQYEPRFEKIAAKTLLANGKRTFDIQFRGIARTILEKNLDFAPADIESPIRIFVGAEPAQDVEDQREPRLLRQLGVAAREHHPQLLVAHRVQRSSVLTRSAGSRL